MATNQALIKQDGIYEKSTELEVRSIQAKLNLEQDGIVTTNFMQKLEGHLVQLNYKNEQKKELQRVSTSKTALAQPSLHTNFSTNPQMSENNLLYPNQMYISPGLKTSNNLTVETTDLEFGSGELEDRDVDKIDEGGPYMITESNENS